MAQKGQYADVDAVPDSEEYRPQPFEQLAKVWRSEGSHSEATTKTFDRLDLERKVYDGPVFDGSHGFRLRAASDREMRRSNQTDALGPAIHRRDWREVGA
jgi:hypothetical protein